MAVDWLISGDVVPEPRGLRFLDCRSGRELVYVQDFGQAAHGWLCYEHSEGRWIALRKATARDFLSIQHDQEEKRMSLQRTTEEIVAKMRELADGEDPHGVERSRLLEALPWKDAQQFLNSDAPHTAESWEVDRTKDHKSVQAQVKAYLGHAWGKANSRRGTSAEKSMAHFRGLLWLLGAEQEELLCKVKEQDAHRDQDGRHLRYSYFGKAALVRISEYVGFDWEAKDDGEWQRVDGTSTTANEALDR